MKMTKTIKVSNDALEEIDVNFEFNSSLSNRPDVILGGDVTIVGANNKHDLVLLGRKNASDSNNNSVLEHFERDGDIQGNVLIILIDLVGNPIDLTLDKLTF